jgi:uncharacterized membrane protein
MSSESKLQSAPAVTTALRDELVRAMLPDLQTLVRHTVDTAVARSTAPLLDQLRELQAELRELRSVPTRPEPAASARRVPEPAAPTRAVQAETPATITRTSPTRPVETVACEAAIAVERPRVRPPMQAVPDTAMDADIPTELNGMRRKKAVAWAVGVLVTMLLLSAAGISILSNLGTHI